MSFKLRGLRNGRDAAGLFATTAVLCMGFVFAVGITYFLSHQPHIHIPIVIGIFVVVMSVIFSLRTVRENAHTDLELIEKLHGKKIEIKQQKYRFGKIIQKDDQDIPTPPSAEKIRQMKEGAPGWRINKSNSSRDDDAESQLA